MYKGKNSGVFIIAITNEAAASTIVLLLNRNTTLLELLCSIKFPYPVRCRTTLFHLPAYRKKQQIDNYPQSSQEKSSETRYRPPLNPNKEQLTNNLEFNFS